MPRLRRVLYHARAVLYEARSPRNSPVPKSCRDRRATYTRMSVRERKGDGAYRSHTCCVRSPAPDGRRIEVSEVHEKTIALSAHP